MLLGIVEHTHFYEHVLVFFRFYNSVVRGPESYQFVYVRPGYMFFVLIFTIFFILNVLFRCYIYFAIPAPFRYIYLFWEMRSLFLFSFLFGLFSFVLLYNVPFVQHERKIHLFIGNSNFISIVWTSLVHIFFSAHSLSPIAVKMYRVTTMWHRRKKPPAHGMKCKCLVSY